MPTTKIHCGYYELFGPDWSKVKDETAGKIINTLELLDLQGEEPNLFGFVGTEKTETVVGGFFAVQYAASLRHYDKNKRLNFKTEEPFERLFFILFAKTGKLILQHKKFNENPLSMERVTRLIKEALTTVLVQSKFGFLLSLNLPENEVVIKERFQTEFNISNRVERLKISAPNPDDIPPDINYYNPNYEKNPIIRESHQHDYPNFETIDLEASEHGDLKNTHLAKDLIRAGTPIYMKYSKNNEIHILKQTILSKFEIYIDTGVEAITKDMLNSIVDLLKKEYRLPIDVPTSTDSLGRMSLLRYQDEEEAE